MRATVKFGCSMAADRSIAASPAVPIIIAVRVENRFGSGTSQWPYRRTRSMIRRCEPSQDAAAHQTAIRTAYFFERPGIGEAISRTATEESVSSLFD